MVKFDVEMRGLALILLFMFAVWSCTSPADGELSRAEGLMEEHPDSALVLLEGIGSSSLTTDGSRALYALLLTQARDKNYIDETDDSLISVATEYFEADDEPRRAMLSSFYHGRILMNGERYPEALCYMARAYDGAEALGDNFWMGRAAEQMAKIYGYNYHDNEALAYSLISYENLVKSSNKRFIKYAKAYLASDDMNAGQDSTAYRMCCELIDSLGDDAVLSEKVYRVMCKSLYGLRRYDEVIENVKHLGKIDELSPDVLCLLGISYLKVSDKSAADSVLEIMRGRFLRESLALSIELALENGDYRRAYNDLQVLHNTTDSVFLKSLNQQFTKSVHDTYSEISARQQSEYTARHTRNMMVFLAVLLILTIFIAYLIYRHRREREKIESNVLIADNLREILSVKETENREIIDTVYRLVSDKYEIVDRLCQELYEKPSKIAKEKISEIVESLLKSFTSGENIMELEGTVRKCYGDVLESLKSDVENIKREDYLLFVYTILGFSSNTVALLLGESNIQAVYNRKKRLKQKLRKLPTEKQVKYRHFLG